MQGRDLLSPFLFNIVSEAMGGSILKARKLSLISGFEAWRGGEVVTHLQFTRYNFIYFDKVGRNHHFEENLKMLPASFGAEDQIIKQFPSRGRLYNGQYSNLG